MELQEQVRVLEHCQPSQNNLRLVPQVEDYLAVVQRQQHLRQLHLEEEEACLEVQLLHRPLLPEVCSEMTVRQQNLQEVDFLGILLLHSRPKQLAVDYLEINLLEVDYLAEEERKLQLSQLHHLGNLTIHLYLALVLKLLSLQLRALLEPQFLQEVY